MRDEHEMDEVLNSVGEGGELALPGDTIRKRHIATRASNRRMIVVLTVGDAEFKGYSIGLDSHSLQILELPSGEVSSIALEYIVSISDGIPFSELARPERDVVDRRTASFRKTSHNWLVENWPRVYDRRDDVGDHRPGVPSLRVNPRLIKTEFTDREKRFSDNVDS
jgi:hypothetical protein